MNVSHGQLLCLGPTKYRMSFEGSSNVLTGLQFLFGSLSV
jgi:hypothetical protein